MTPSKNSKNLLVRSVRSTAQSRLIAAIVITAVVVVGVVVLRFSLAANRSGMPWRSGNFSNGSSYVENNAFGTWRGVPVDVAVTWPNRTTWNDFINTNAIYQNYTNRGMTPVFGVPLVPEGESATVSQCATGAFNSKWVTFANTMNGINSGNVIIRLGWEFNGDWYKWGAQNPATFAQCWNQIVGTVKPLAPNIKWDWTVNRGVSKGMGDPTQAYPNNAYVDYIGIDSYNSWADWNTQLNGTQGLNYWLNWAKSHGKQLSVPEWGAIGGTGSNGDQGFYATNMFNFFKANAAYIAYEAYFNESPVYHSAIFNPNQNPNTSAVYLSLWKTAVGTGGGGTPIPTTPTPTPTIQILQTGNLLSGKTFTSSVGDSTDEPGNPVTNVNDKNEQSRWISLPQDGATISADLGSSYTLNKVSIIWAADTVKNYAIQTSANNTSWTTVATGTTNNSTSQLINTTSFTATPTGRYVRIVATDRWNAAYGNSIYEIGVYGIAGTVTPTPAPTSSPAASSSDLNGDGKVNVFDLSILLGQWTK